MYLPAPGFEPTSSEFLDKCVTRQGTVAGYGRDEKKTGTWVTMAMEGMQELGT